MQARCRCGSFRKCAGRDVTVALSGDGADELFGGYKTYIADRYARRLRMIPHAIRAVAARAARCCRCRMKRSGSDYKITRMLEGSLLGPVDAHLYWNGTFAESQRRALMANPAGSAAGLRVPGSRRGRRLRDDVGYLNQFLWLDQVGYLPDDILNKCDRMSMAHSLEVRPPFLDHRIAEFAARLPEGLKIHGSQLKFVLRQLMKDKLPLRS